MAIFASDDHLAVLRDAAVSDPDAALRARALDALAQQHQTHAWEHTVAGLLALPDEALRSWAIDRLVAHNSDSSWARVHAHATHEVSPALRAKIEAAEKARLKH